MINDENFLEVSSNDKTRTLLNPDYQNIFLNYPTDSFDEHVQIFKINYERANTYKFRLHSNRKTFNETKKSQFTNFKRYYKLENNYLSHFQLHNVIKFINNSNILYTTYNSINVFNLIKGKSKIIYQSKNSKFIDYNKKASLIVSNDKEKAVIYNLKNRMKFENVKFYENDDVLGRMMFFEKDNDPFLTAVGNHKKVYLYDLEKQKNFLDFDAIDYVNDSCFIEEKNSFIVAMDSKIIISKDIRDKNKNALIFNGHIANNFAVCKIDENYFASAGEDGKTIIWDIRYPEKIINQFQSKKPVYSLRYNKKKKILVSLQTGMEVNLYKLDDLVVKEDIVSFVGLTTGIDINQNGDSLVIGITEISPGMLVFHLD